MSFCFVLEQDTWPSSETEGQLVAEKRFEASIFDGFISSLAN